MDKEKIQKITETDNFIIKIVLILFISVVFFLVTLIIFKFAIEQKLIFKISQYF